MWVHELTEQRNYKDLRKKIQTSVSRSEWLNDFRQCVWLTLSCFGSVIDLHLLYFANFQWKNIFIFFTNNDNLSKLKKKHVIHICLSFVTKYHITLESLIMQYYFKAYHHSAKSQFWDVPKCEWKHTRVVGKTVILPEISQKVFFCGKMTTKKSKKCC